MVDLDHLGSGDYPAPDVVLFSRDSPAYIAISSPQRVVEDYGVLIVEDRSPLVIPLPDLDRGEFP